MPYVREEELGEFDVKAIYEEDPNVIIELNNGTRLEMFLDGLALKGSDIILTWETVVAFLRNAERVARNKLRD